MYQHRVFRLSSVLFALTACSSYLYAAPVLSAGKTTINLSCTKGTATCSPASDTSQITASGGSPIFNVPVPSVPWLNVSNTGSGGTLGVADATGSHNVLNFAVNNAWTTLSSGLNTTSVVIACATCTAQTGVTIVVNLQVNDATPTLVVKGGLNAANSLTLTTGVNSLSIPVTVLSSDGLPLAFSVSATSANAPEGQTNWLSAPAQTAYVAYSWGTSVTFTANTTGAVGGDVWSGTIVLTPAGGTAVNLPVSISVSAAPPTFTSVTPSSVPLISGAVTPGTVTFVVKGSNFVSGPGPQKTSVFYGTGSPVSYTLINTNNVEILNANYLTVAVPYGTDGSPFKSASTPVTIGVNNGTGPTGPASGATQVVTVTGAPIINTITSASSFVLAGSAPNVAPYDIVSIFGTNFCPLCVGAQSIQVGALDSFYRFPKSLSPDASHNITVTFSKPGTPATNLPGYLLFATNTQINVLVPGAIATLVGTVAPNVGLVNVQVAYDTASPATNVSAAFQVTPVAADPGIFTVSSNGQGAGAITTATTFVLNTSSTPAAYNSDSSTAAANVAIFMTGLGAPSAGVANDSGNTGSIALLGLPGSATAAPGGYMGTVNSTHLATPFTGAYNPASNYVAPSPLWTSIDGAVIRSALILSPLTGPTLSALPYITLTNITTGDSCTFQAGSAGFAGDSVAGLYQVNFVVPDGTTSNWAHQQSTGTNRYTVVVSYGGVYSSGAWTTPPTAVSQSGVTMYITY